MCGGSSEPLAHVGEGVEVLVRDPARSQQRPGCAWVDPVMLADRAKLNPRQVATVVLPIRVGVSWSCSNCATIFTRTP
jgi:hypothetical protein